MDKPIRKRIKGIADKQIHSKINAIMGHMQCPKDFKCVHSGFEGLCVVRDCGMADYVECLQGKQLSCKFVIVFGPQYFCKCPLRVYTAKNLGK